MSFAEGQIEPIYFDRQGHPLFGCYHAPAHVSMRGCAALLCYPIGHEYLQFHRSYRQLARHLAASGIPVLRFDYFGCGDSSGADGQGGIDCWLQDIAAALAELRHRSRTENTCLVGARMGAALAMMAGLRHGGLDAMVLWEPVVSGRAHVQELLSAHREMLQRSHVKVKDCSSDEAIVELLGFHYHQSLLSELEAINLVNIQAQAAKRVLIIQSTGGPDLNELVNQMRSLNCAVELQHFNTPRIWLWEENFGKTLVPYHALRSIVAWLSRVWP